MTSEVKKEQHFKLEVVKWEGSLHCAYLNDFRVAGGKPWAGGEIVKTWNVSLRDLTEAVPELRKLSDGAKAAPPELAELQATIAQQAAEIERLRKLPTRNALIKERDRLKDEIERMKGGQGEPVAFIVGNRYTTQEGETVRFVRIHNEGNHYETMEDEQGVNRYTRRDFGRVTGSKHDYSDPRNTPPLYASQPAPASTRSRS